MKKRSLIAAFALAALTFLSGSDLHEKKASLLDYFTTVAQKKQLILGQHVNWNATEMDQTEAIHQQTGQYPAMLGTIVNMYPTWGPMPEQSVADSKKWSGHGGIVYASMWPANPSSGWHAIDTDVDFPKLLIKGSREYNNWHATLDDTAEKLRAFSRIRSSSSSARSSSSTASGSGGAIRNRRISSPSGAKRTTILSTPRDCRTCSSLIM